MEQQALLACFREIWAATVLSWRMTGVKIANIKNKH
jgi:hypothetical protein